jgi:hypothetical protein
MQINVNKEVFTSDSKVGVRLGDFKVSYVQNTLTYELLQERVRAFKGNVLEKLPECPNLIGFDNKLYGICSTYSPGKTFHYLSKTYRDDQNFKKTLTDLTEFSDLTDKLTANKNESELVAQKIKTESKDLATLKNKLKALEEKRISLYTDLVVGLRSRLVEIWGLFDVVDIDEPFKQHILLNYFTFYKLVPLNDLFYQPSGTYINKWYSPKVKPPKITGVSYKYRELIDQGMEFADYEYAYILKNDIYTITKQLKIDSHPFYYKIDFTQKPLYAKQALVFYVRETKKWYVFKMAIRSRSVMVELNNITSLYKITLFDAVHNIDVLGDGLTSPDFDLWYVLCYPMVYNNPYFTDLVLVDAFNFSLAK